MGTTRFDRSEIIPKLGAALFLPAVVLIPFELYILKQSGDLEWPTAITAYLWCLVAKISAVYGVFYFFRLIMPSGVIGAEIFYSLIHFVISAIILRIFFHISGAMLAKTAGLISTVIPWAYSIAVPVTAALLFMQ
jgi:hypothetical protein